MILFQGFFNSLQEMLCIKDVFLLIFWYIIKIWTKNRKPDDFRIKSISTDRGGKSK